MRARDKNGWFHLYVKVHTDENMHSSSFTVQWRRTHLCSSTLASYAWNNNSELTHSLIRGCIYHWPQVLQLVLFSQQQLWRSWPHHHCVHTKNINLMPDYIKCTLAVILRTQMHSFNAYMYSNHSIRMNRCTATCILLTLSQQWCHHCSYTKHTTQTLPGYELLAHMHSL